VRIIALIIACLFVFACGDEEVVKEPVKRVDPKAHLFETEKRKLDDGRELEDSGLIATEENPLGIAPGQIWAIDLTNPFEKDVDLIVITGVKDGYVQFEYVDGSGNPWVKPIRWFQNERYRRVK